MNLKWTAEDNPVSGLKFWSIELKLNHENENHENEQGFWYRTSETGYVKLFSADFSWFIFSKNLFSPIVWVRIFDKLHLSSSPSFGLIIKSFHFCFFLSLFDDLLRKISTFPSQRYIKEIESAIQSLTMKQRMFFSGNFLPSSAVNSKV